MNISGNVTIDLSVHESLTPGLESGGLDLDESSRQSFAAGTGASQGDMKWSKSSVLAAGTSETWTLSALTDALGRAVAFARVRVFLIVPQSTTDGDDLTVGGATTHEWTAIVGGAGQTFLVKSLGAECKVAMNTTGFLVTAGSSDQLKISNPGTHPITYLIALVGASV